MVPVDPAPRRESRDLPSRRTFLIAGGGAIGLGVAFALWPRQWPDPQPIDPQQRPFNAWIRIAPDGTVTVAVPQAEMGQGVLSGFAQIVADEMGADWARMGVEPAPLHPAYANPWLAGHLAAALPRGLQALAASAGASFLERIGFQATVASTSIRAYEAVLRQAAAAARQTLVRAAARDWEVNADHIHAAAGQLIYKARHLDFGAATALVTPADVPEQAAIRPQRTRQLAGKSLPRIDIPSKVDGSARFGADVRVPGMLFAAIRHGPTAESRLDRATAPPGVRMVRGPNWVAALGQTGWEAQRALDRVEARFQTSAPRPGPWIERELAAAARAGHGQTIAAEGGELPPPGAGTVVAEYRTPYLAHATMEPMVATARLTAGRVEIWTPTESLSLTTQAVARALDVDVGMVTVYPTLLGGGFGARLEATGAVEAARIAQAVGMPVQLQWSREEDLSSGVFRPCAAARMRADLDGNGRILAWEARIAAPSAEQALVARAIPSLGTAFPTGAEAIAGANRIPYAAERFRAVHVPVQYPVPVGYWRGAAHGFTSFFVESFIDELAARARSDPLLFRRRLLQDRPRHRAVLDRVAAEADWGGATARGFGRGIAIHESFGSIVAMVVEAGVDDQGIRLRRVVSAVDCGQALNPDSVCAQIEGAAIMGLTAAINGRIDFADGAPVQRNFDTYPLLRLADMPPFTTRIVRSDGPAGGAGEPGLPPAAPALANALAAATGRRIRSLPLSAAFRTP